jgi:translation initiation factor IF-3
LKEPLKNEQIRAYNVILIDDGGVNLGLKSRREALQCAIDKGLDLVMMNPNQETPVCKLIDYGKWRYEQSKQANKQKRHELHEVRCTPVCGSSDLQVKARKVDEFLSNGDDVKVSVFFKGRQMAHKELGQKALNEMFSFLKTPYQVKQPPNLNGRYLSTVLCKSARSA